MLRLCSATVCRVQHLSQAHLVSSNILPHPDLASDSLQNLVLQADSRAVAASEALRVAEREAADAARAAQEAEVEATQAEIKAQDKHALEGLALDALATSARKAAAKAKAHESAKASAVDKAVKARKMADQDAQMFRDVCTTYVSCPSVGHIDCNLLDYLQVPRVHPLTPFKATPVQIPGSW